MTTIFAELEKYYKLFENNSSPHSVRGYKDSISRFINKFNIKNVEDINNLRLRDFEEFKYSLQSDGLKESSINVHILRVKAFLNWAWNNEYISNDIFKRVKALPIKVKKEIFTLTDDECKNMVSTAKSLQEKTMLVLMFELGTRRAEVASIKLSDIEDCKITLHGKGNKHVSMVMKPEVCSLLKEYIGNRKSNSEYLFYSKKFKEGITGQAVGDRFKKAAKLAGISDDRIKNITAHVARKTFGSRIANEYGPLVAMKALRHAHLATTMNSYVKVDQNKVDAAILGQSILFETGD